MKSLSNLKNTTRPAKNRNRVGRGIGSGNGKTCGRGEKGAGSRSGYTRRATYEGGQYRLFQKLPVRGFSNIRFQKRLDSINLDQIDKMFEDGEMVNCETLAEKGFFSGPTHGIKILGNGTLSKKVTIVADAYSKGARDKLQQSGIAFHNAQENQK